MNKKSLDNLITELKISFNNYLFDKQIINYDIYKKIEKKYMVNHR